MYIMCVCLFSTLSRRVGTLQICTSSDCLCTGWKHITKCCSMFYISKRKAHGTAQPAEQSAQTGEKVDWKVKQNCELVDLNESSVLSFDCCVNFKLTVTAAGRNSLSSLSGHESITTQDTVLSMQGKVRSKWQPGPNISSVKRHASGKHHVASPRSVQPMNLTHGLPQAVTTRDCKALCGLDFRQSSIHTQFSGTNHTQVLVFYAFITLMAALPYCQGDKEREYKRERRRARDERRGREKENKREKERERWNTNSNSKTLLHKDYSLGSIKT